MYKLNSVTRKLLTGDVALPVAASGAGGRAQPQLLPPLQQALHVRGAPHGAHEVRTQGPQRFRCSRFGLLMFSNISCTCVYLISCHPLYTGPYDLEYNIHIV
jgi:hypothetical protein